MTLHDSWTNTERINQWQLDPQEPASVKYKSKYNTFHSICILWYSKSLLFYENLWHSLEVLSQYSREYWVLWCLVRVRVLMFQVVWVWVRVLKLGNRVLRVWVQSTQAPTLLPSSSWDICLPYHFPHHLPRAVPGSEVSAAHLSAQTHQTTQVYLEIWIIVNVSDQQEACLASSAAILTNEMSNKHFISWMTGASFWWRSNDRNTVN